MNIPDKKKLKLDTVRLWCLTTGYEETNDEIEVADLSFIKNGYRTSFITEFDKTSEELKKQTAVLKSFYDYIYIVTNDRQKRKYIEETAIKGVGIMCSSNPFGLGQMFEVLKEAELLN